MKKISIILVLILYCSCKVAEKERYSIPYNYVGNIYIFSNIKNGASPNYRFYNTRIYLIPETGILLTEFRETYGIINKTFFYETKDQKSIKIPGIPFSDDKSTLDAAKIYAFYGDDITFTFPKAKDTIGVQIITVCKPGDFYSKSHEPFRKLIEGVHFSLEDLTYEKLLNKRQKLNK